VQLRVLCGTVAMQTGEQVHLGATATVKEELQFTVHWSGAETDCQGIRAALVQEFYSFCEGKSSILVPVLVTKIALQVSLVVVMSACWLVSLQSQLSAVQ